MLATAMMANRPPGFSDATRLLLKASTARNVVIDVTEENRIAARVGQISSSLCAFDHQVTFVNPSFLAVLARLPQTYSVMSVANTRARANPIRERQQVGHTPKPDPDIGHGHAGLQLQHLNKGRRIALGLPALLRNLRGVGLLCMHGADSPGAPSSSIWSKC